MARKPTQPSGPSPKLNLTPADMRNGIARLKKRLQDLNAFNASQMSENSPPELKALEASIERALATTFGEDTADFRRFSEAASLRWYPMLFGGTPTPLSTYRENVGNRISQARAILEQSIKSLEEDLEETSSSDFEEFKDISSALLRQAFIVHGHDDGARETVARFLEKLNFDAIILHEQANKGRTVIEKIEGHSEIGFAVVLLTPDDEGCAKGGTPEPRARQNVLLELGYFIGKLGRERVCALKRGKVEIPSDFAGVVWQDMDDGGAWKQALARELNAVGYDIDWNQVMR